MSEPLYERLRGCAEPPKFDEFGIPCSVQRAFCAAMGNYILDGAHGFWLPPESGDGHCKPEKLVETLATRMDCLSSFYSDQAITSPIEGMLLAALLWVEMDWAGFAERDFLGGGPTEHQKTFGPFSGLHYFITAQAPIGSYKADFLLWFANGTHHSGIVIECDGHDFHEKTKEQATRDKRRDREILTAGYPVLRFTGSEIYRDAIACADQVRNAATSVLARLSKDTGLMGG